MIAITALALTAAPPMQPNIMVSGGVRRANPGRDIANVKVENTLLPRRQRESGAFAAVDPRAYLPPATRYPGCK